ncbi:hypothetical protein [Rhodoferax sp.]|uniref:hypothetical protein n=1 Tax=Rhodoferax sp. TaxID=50421 RepID=UPI0026140922|nr:hypothetical protein [Rhodoferax sp.]
MSIDGVSALATVRLAALVPWLMQTRRLPFVAAVRALHEALAGLEGLSLYVAQKSGLARVVGASDAFGLDAPVQGLRIISRGIDMPSVPTQGRALSVPAQARAFPDGVTPGLSAALYLIREGWGSGRHDESILERDDAYGPCLLMPCDQAAALWGVVALAAMAPEPLTLDAIKNGAGKNKRGEWLPEAKAVMQSEINKRQKLGERAPIESVAKAIGKTRQAVTGALARQPKRVKANAARGTFSYK